MLGEFGGGPEGSDATALREQSVVGENAGGSDEGGVGDEPAAHGEDASSLVGAF